MALPVQEPGSSPHITNHVHCTCNDTFAPSRIQDQPIAAFSSSSRGTPTKATPTEVAPPPSTTSSSTLGDLEMFLMGLHSI